MQSSKRSGHRWQGKFSQEIKEADLINVRRSNIGYEHCINFQTKYSLPFKKLNGDSVNVVGSRSHMSDETLKFINELKENNNNVNIISKGSSLKLCLVAEGKADVYPRFAPTMEWDTAAGQAIVENAGGTVLNYQTKQPMVYNKKELLNPWFLVVKDNMDI